jgi:aspartyl-tRNA synthetase
MLRSHTCGELNQAHIGNTVTLCGWVQTVRDFGGMTFIDLRDRYGITQLVIDSNASSQLKGMAKVLGREFVLRAEGKVTERSNKNLNIPTGTIEVILSSAEVLNESKVPPFTIEDETDGGEELRARYRYLDLRRNPLKNNLILRHKLAIEVRKYLDAHSFIEVETPVLIKSTPEGARDFVVPSRVHKGEFYALPQSPQTFKQLLMVSGYDKYFQIVKCFRDEDLRADRQPEFTQLDCEMSFITQEDILNMFEGLVKHVFKQLKGADLGDFPRMTYDDAIYHYGSDKPDIRFGMTFKYLKYRSENHIPSSFKIFDEAESVIGICIPNGNSFTRKQLDDLTDFVKRPQVGAGGMVYIRYNEDKTLKSSVDKFYNEVQLKAFADIFNANPNDIILLLSGETEKTQKALNELRLHVAETLGLRDKQVFKPLWVLDFPMFEKDEESNRFHAMHHPFTSPKPEDISKLDSNPLEVKANAYDLVMNGTELGGGSIRIFNKDLQAKVFELLGFTSEEANKQFGFLMNAFEYGAPPHGGIALGFDRWVSLMAGENSIRDVMAFPKNNAGKDVMINSPSEIANEQLKELNIKIA